MKKEKKLYIKLYKSGLDYKYPSVYETEQQLRDSLSSYDSDSYILLVGRFSIPDLTIIDDEQLKEFKFE